MIRPLDQRHTCSTTTPAVVLGGGNRAVQLKRLPRFAPHVAHIKVLHGQQPYLATTLACGAQTPSTAAVVGVRSTTVVVGVRGTGSVVRALLVVTPAAAVVAAGLLAVVAAAVVPTRMHSW